MFSVRKVLRESVLRHTWDGVTSQEVKNYLDAGGLDLYKDPKNPGMYLAYKGKKMIFRYDPEDMELMSDYTIIDLEDGRI